MEKVHVLGRNENVLAWLGMRIRSTDAASSKFFKSITTYYVAFIIYAFLVGSNAVLVYENWPEITLMWQPLSLVFAGFQIGGMYLSIGFHLKQMHTLHFQLQQIVDAEHDEKGIAEIYWSIEKKCQKYTVIFICYIVWNECGLVGTLIYSIYCILSGDYDASRWPLPFSIWIPFDGTTLCGWYLLWFILVNMSMCYALCFIAITSYFVSCCLYIGAICDHFDFLCSSMKEDIDRYQCENDSIKCHRLYLRFVVKMHRIVKIHVEMLEAFKLVSDINSGSIFWLLPPNLFFMALSLYGMENTTFGVAEFLFQIICIIVSLLWPFLHCYFADITTTRMNTIGGIIYAIDWFQLPVELQSQIILIIARSQKHVHFNGFGLVHCSLEVLGKLWKTSISYYMVCRGLAQR